MTHALLPCREVARVSTVAAGVAKGSGGQFIDDGVGDGRTQSEALNRFVRELEQLGAVETPPGVC